MNLLKNGAKGTPPVAYQFGDFRLDPANRLLTRLDGTPVPLTPRVFETLLFMVQHHGTVLDKERLMEAVWPDSIVEENNLTQHISTLRRVFGETPASRGFIVTVPGRGYRLAAEVEMCEPSAGEPEKAAQISNLPEENTQTESVAFGQLNRPTRTLRPVLLAALVILLGALAFLWWRSGAHPPGAKSTELNPIEKSIAVLPFENLSDEKENAYFAAGIQDDVLTSLAQIHALKVISRVSVMAYRNPTGRNMREIGEALGVANVLEGSVRREGKHILVNVQLIDARNDRHLWAQRYDRTVADSIGLQGELATQIATALQAQLAPEEKVSLETKPTDNPAAYALYLQARGRESEDQAAADQLYRRAIALDPKFALARARRSILNCWFASGAGVKLSQADARTEAEEALRLSPSLGEAHTAVGLCLYLGEKNYAGALKEFSIAAAISPNDPEILIYIGGIYRRQGRWQESLAAFEHAQELDPRNTNTLVLAANSRLFVRDWTGARALYSRRLAIAPDGVGSRTGLAYLEVVQNSNPAAGRILLRSVPPGLDPDGAVTEARWDLAMLERDYASAEKILADYRAEIFPIGGGPVIFYQGLTALARGDVESARRYLAAAASTFEKWVRDDPADPGHHADLGLCYAYAQRKEEAIRETRRSIELEPESRDAFHGAINSANLALIDALVGEEDEALTLIERLLSTPGTAQGLNHPQNITLAELRLRWEWDSLRSNPRFQKILAGPEPKTTFANVTPTTPP